MHRHGGARRYWLGLKFVLFGVAAVAVVGFGIRELWNGLMPGLFGLHAVGFWQALGLFLLARILLGGFRCGPGSHWRHRMRERWERMTPEERERLCRHFDGFANQTPKVDSQSGS